jgi:glycerophosphoryl diester phosphodiesterase
MFLKVGHRGAKAYEIENTLESFSKAIESGANAIELDVRMSGDGHLVVSHDDNLKGVFGRDMHIHAASLQDLKHATENRLLTLGEALRFISKRVKKILIELKETGYEKKVLDVIRQEHLGGMSIIVSFHEEALLSIRASDRNIETGLIYAKSKNPVEIALRLDVQYLVPLYRFVHRNDVEKAHQNGLKVIVWTINTTAEAQAYLAKGVDGIATDRPDIFRGLRVVKEEDPSS